MIYRKWSLLTGPTAILGGIVGTVVVLHYTFIESPPFFKQTQKKPELGSSTK